MNTFPRSRAIERAVLRLAGVLAIVACSCGDETRASREAHAAAPGAPIRIAGLEAPARIVTDRYGISHVEAASLRDLYFAWGFVTARERLWQLEATRRAAEGHLSQWFGNSLLKSDGGAQLFDLRTLANQMWARDQGDSGAWAVVRYSEGVNAWIARCRRGEAPWPPEFRRLHHEPADWKPEDVALVLLAQGAALDLAFPEIAEGARITKQGHPAMDMRTRYESANLYDTVPDSAARRLFPPNRRGPPRQMASDTTRMGHALPDRGSRAWEQALLARAAQALPLWRADDDPERRASNVFAVGTGRSVSGYPMLANDPHLSLSTPGALHVVHLTVPGVVNAIGGCVPGLPAIVTGRNERCAWGVTSLAADVVDVYADTLSDDGKRARWQGEWIPVRTAPFDLSYKVAGVPFPVFGQERHYTPHGPVLAIDKRHHIALAARWTGALESVSLVGVLGIEREGSAAGICERFRALETPCLNVVACDRDGDLRYQAVGLLPWRRSDPGPGPIPGDEAHDWRAFVPPDQMPSWQPPRSGFVVNSNNRPIGPAYPVTLPRYAWAQDRALRIAERLTAEKDVSIATLSSIQNDVQVRAAKRVLPLLLACADSVRETLSPRARSAIQMLRGWDMEARRDEVAPTLYRAWLGALQRRSDLRGAPGLMEAALDGRAPLALRDKDGMPERAALAAMRALDLALEELSKELGGDLAGWAWSRAHRARFKHVGDSDPHFEHAPEPADGDAGTVCVGPGTLPYGTTYDFGPVFRHVVDLANADSSLGVVAPGNSGVVDGPHASDHLARWANHTYVPFYLSWAAAEAAAEDSLILRP